MVCGINEQHKNSRKKREWGLKGRAQRFGKSEAFTCGYQENAAEVLNLALAKKSV